MMNIIPCPYVYSNIMDRVLTSINNHKKHQQQPSEEEEENEEVIIIIIINHNYHAYIVDVIFSGTDRISRQTYFNHHYNKTGA